MTRSSLAWRVGRAAGLAAVALLFLYFLQQPFPLPAKVLAALLLLVSVVSPETGLLVFAGLAPLSSAIAGLCGGGAGLGAQLIEQMALGVGSGVLVRRPLEPPRTRIGPPALLMAIVAAASAAALLPLAAAPVTPDLMDGTILHQVAVRPTVQYSPWTPLFSALMVAECGFLGWAVERLVRQTPSLGRRLIAIALIGQAASSTWTVLALLSGALRTGDVFGALPGLLMSVRINLQTDVHAAASLFILAGIAGIALGNGSRARAVGVGLLLALVALGLWITASRVALVLGVVTFLAVIGWLIARTRRTPRWVIAGIAILALGAGSAVTFYMLNPPARNSTIERSTSVRLVLARAGLKMFEERPVFGIGIGRFYAVSPQYLAGSGENYRENAHNNFLQVLAEQGVVGFIAFMWWLSVVVIGGVRAQRANPTIDRGCLLAAIAACIGTWITGHPLLVAEFAFLFSLYFGILSASTPSAPHGRPWILGLIIAAVLLSVPPRATALRDAADLEYQGLGLSLWQHDDTQRYREVGGSFALFLPSTGRSSKVPIRRVAGAPEPLIVEISIAGRLLQTVPLSGEAWQDVLIVVPSGSRRFERVDFVARPQMGSSDITRGMVRVGKSEAP